MHINGMCYSVLCDWICVKYYICVWYSDMVFKVEVAILHKEILKQFKAGSNWDASHITYIMLPEKFTAIINRVFWTEMDI